MSNQTRGGLKNNKMRKIFFYTFIGLIVVLSVNSSASPLLYDDFNASILDTTKWNIIEQNGVIDIQNGNLRIEGSGPKDINSWDTFSYSIASAYIKIGGDYQKFGFNVNDGNGLPAFYFDSYEIGQPSPGGVNTIHIIGFGETYSTQDLLFRKRFEVSWNEYHQFDIMWGEDSIQFFIDNDLKYAFDYSYSSSTLPIGIWNDRSGTMLIDEVSVTPIPAPSSILLMFIGLLGLMCYRLKRF